MSQTTENPLELYHEGIGLETHEIYNGSFIARPGVTPYRQELLDAFITQIKKQAPRQTLPRSSQNGLYQPISEPYEIRLLEIKPGVGTEQLQGSLHHCTVEFDRSVVNSRPRWAMSCTDYTTPIFFTALSYTWGSPVFDKTIECDGFVKNITESLEVALRQFRHPHDSILMWIDQICINQEDEHEKEQQIPLMSRIYSLATTTVIWLGEASEGSELAVRLLEQIVSCLQFTFENPSFDDLERLCLPAADSKQWEYLCKLLTRKWFTRVWIIQEAVLSGYESTWFACGETFIPWETLEKACLFLDSCGISAKLAERFPTQITNAVPLGKVMSNIEAMKSGSPVLFTLLTKTRNAQCWDPRDRIYGLLGLLNDRDQAVIKVSYASDCTAAGLYRDTVAYFIQGDDPSPWMCLSIALAEADHESSDLPSWVPDWRVPPSVIAFSSPLAYAGVYNACGRFGLTQRRGEPMAKIQGSLLTAPGVFFDTIVEITDMFTNPNLSLQSPKTENIALRTAVDFCSQINHRTNNTIDFDALWNTLVGGKDDGGLSKCPQSFAEIFSFLIDETTGKSPSLPGQTYSTRQRLPVGRGRIDLSSLSQRTLGQTFQKARMAFKRAMGNRRLGITSKGHLGLFHERVKIGDAIYVFDRCPLPYTLRKVGSDGSKFQFIGECFVYGIMNGEAVQSEDIFLEELTLQ